MSKKTGFNKKSLIKSVAQNAEVTSVEQIEGAVESIFNEVSTALVCGDRVEIRGFGSMVVKKRAKGKVRNPKSGQVIEANDRGSLYFRASRELIKVLNTSTANTK